MKKYLVLPNEGAFIFFVK